MKRTAILLLVGMILAGAATTQAADDGWISLFDGKTFKGWKASENQNCWKIEAGSLVCNGPRSHLFYTGGHAPFKNFEFKAEVMTTPGSNAGIYFHTRYQERGWPKHGFEAQVNNTHRDNKKTGSLYGVVDVTEAPAKDNQWFTQHILLQGNKIVVKINDKIVMEYTQAPDAKPGNPYTRFIDQGTFALQGHDPKSKVYFKNIRVKKLPEKK